MTPPILITLTVLLLLSPLGSGRALAQATAVGCGTRLLRSLPNNAVDTFQFTVRRGEGVSVDLTDAADPLGGEFGHRLYDPSGELIDEDCLYGFDLVDADPGTYRFEVFRCIGRGATQYSLAVFGITDTFNGAPSCGRPLSCQQDNITGTFADLDPGPELRSGATDAYRLSLASGTYAVVSAVDVSNRIGLLELRIYDEDGELLEDTCDGVVEGRVPAGNYTILVNDCLGMDTGNYRLVFDSTDCAGTPADSCTGATAIGGTSFVDVVSVEDATRSPADPFPTCGEGTREYSVWYRYVPPRDGTLLVDTFASTYDTVLSTYTGACGAFTPVAGGCNDDSGSLASQIAIPVRAGVPHSFMVSALDELLDGSTLAFALQFVDGSVEATPTPTAASGDCCSERPDQRGCEQASCQTCICSTDSYCCLEEWDEFCAGTAFDRCANLCACASGTPPTPTSTPTRSITPTPAPGCEGDCNGNGEVTVDELVRGVGIAQGSAPLSSCPAIDADGDGEVTVTDLVRAVGRALGGCE